MTKFLQLYRGTVQEYENGDQFLCDGQIMERHIICRYVWLMAFEEKVELCSPKMRVSMSETARLKR